MKSDVQDMSLLKLQQHILGLGHKMARNVLIQSAFFDTTLDTPRVILFGGHRLSVHNNFRLYLTTTIPPASLPETTICDLNVINLDYSIPLGQDILLHAACMTLLPESHQRFGATCKELAEAKSELRDLDQDLFKSLPKQGKTDCYWHSTDKIKSIMRKKNNVSFLSFFPSD